MVVATLERTVLRAQSFASDPRRAVAELRAGMVQPDMSLGLKDRLGEVFCRNNTAGFSIYGEQFHGVHVNRTLTGIAFGEARRDA
jgi:hypothetical protein